MNKKIKGFSLAELLISLLIISIVLSAAIPAVTKKAGQQRELIWRWTEQNHVAFSAVGANQSVILGLDALPMEGSAITALLKDKSAFALTSAEGAVGEGINDRDSVAEINLSGVKYSDYGDKLAILKRKIDGDSSNFVNSHISFFNMGNSAGDTNAEYAGRLAMDAGNIALGIGTLQSIDKANKGENTAIGHFALLRDSDGFRNTAIGKKSLSYNDSGSYNTAIGFGSLFMLGKETVAEENVEKNYENTAVGAESQYAMGTGSFNTTVGSQAMKYNVSGDNNTIMGRLAMAAADEGSDNTVIGANTFLSFKTGSNNVVIGSNACSYLSEGDGNICIGSGAGNSSGLTEDSDGVYIGGSGDDNAPLISGHTLRRAKTDTLSGHDQELIVNARKVVFQPYLGRFPVFEFESLYGSDGYSSFSGDAPETRYGILGFNLRDTGSHDDALGGSSIKFQMLGAFPDTNTGKMLLVNSFNPYAPVDTNGAVSEDSYSDIYVNNKLLIDFPKTTDDYQHVNIGLYDSYNTTYKNSENVIVKQNQSSIPLALNGKIFITYNDATPQLSMNPTDGFKVETNAQVASNDTKASYGLFKLKAGGGSSMFMQFGEDSYMQAGTQTNSDGTTTNVGFVYNGNDAPYIIHAGCGMYSSGDVGSGAGELADTCKSEIVLDEVAYIARFKVVFAALSKSLVATDSGVVGSARTGDLAMIIDWLYGQIKSPSDIRLKNVQGDSKAGLKEINQLEVKDFTYKNDELKTPHVGVIAQQLKKVFPNAVSEDKDGYLRIRKEDIFFAMVNAIKELTHQLQELAAKVTGLDKRLTELEQQNKILKEQNAAFEKRFADIEKQQAVLVRKQNKLETKQKNLEKRQTATAK